MKAKRSVLYGLLAGVLLFCSTASLLSAADELKATGVLQAVEAGERIIIDDRGFRADRNIRVFDGEKNEVLLYRLGLPALVRYSYRYTRQGVVLSRIQEIPQ